MSILIAVLTTLLGLLALLTIPVDLAFKINHIKKTDGQVNIRWLFGLVRFHIDIPDATRAKKAKPESQPKDAKESWQHGKGHSSKNGFVVLKQPVFRRRLYRFIRDLLRATHYQDLYLGLRVGLGDPADTGRLWAFLGPVAAMADNVHSTTVSIKPEFIDTVFEFKSHGVFRLIPLEFIVLTIAFALSPPSLRTWRILYQGNT